MKLVKMAWVLGGVAAFGLGIAAEGCSSNQGTSDLGGGTNCAALSTCCATLGTAGSQCTTTLNAMNDTNCGTYLAMIMSNGLCTGSGTSAASNATSSSASTTVGTSTTTTMGGNSSTSTTSAGSSGSSSSCEAPPAKVYSETTAGVYCPFSGADGGKAMTCAAGQHCCEPATGTATCTAAGTACAAMESDWQCEGAPDCAGMSGTVCCGTGTVTTDPSCPMSPYVSGFTGSTCSASCTAATNFQVCSQTSECPSGKTCTPIKVKGNDIGYCL